MAKNQHEWGRSAAKSRYGSSPEFSPPSDAQQAPQFPEDKHGPKYNNDTPNNWLRGGPNESAEGKPAFDKHKAGR